MSLIVSRRMGVSTVLLLGCNGVLGNEPGHLVDRDAGDAGDASIADASGDGGASPEGGASADAPPEAEAGADAAATADTGVDTGAGGEAGADANAWTPGALGADLRLWLDGDRGVTASSCASGMCVMRWADQSGNGNDAVLDTTVATAPLQEGALYDGHGAIRFDGSSTSLSVADAVSLHPNHACTIVAVAAEQRAFHEGGLYAKTALLPPYTGMALWGSYISPLPHGTAAAQVDINQYVASPAGGYDDGQLRTFETTFDGTTLSVIVDGMPASYISASPTAPLGASGVPAYIGGNPAGGQVFIGDIAEVVLFMKVLDASEEAMLYAYIRAKYGTL